MNIETKLKEIEQTDYWDAQILDIRSQYMRDEVSIYIRSYAEEDRDSYCWKIKFLRCCKVDYETDALAAGKSEVAVKNRQGAQLYGYSGQDIRLSPHDDSFAACRLLLSNMTIRIICHDIQVSKVPIKEQQFFWDKRN